MDATEILTREEVAAVLAYAAAHAYSLHVRQNAVIFRLTALCGLRAGEVAGLQLADLRLEDPIPHVRVRKATAKRRRHAVQGDRTARTVPLAWVPGNLEALREWRAFRHAQGATGRDPVVCVQTDKRIVPTALALSPGGRSQVGRALREPQIALKFRAALKPLPPPRRQMLHPHSARHTFATYAAAKMPLADVQAALGHRSLKTTSIYLHARPENMLLDANLYDFDGSRGPAAAPPPNPSPAP